MTAPQDEKDIVVGMRVEKFTGEAKWHGVVVSEYQTTRGMRRFVVDVEPQGFQMIAVPSQLRPALAASPSPTEMEFTHVAKTKLDGLLADGWQVNGYSIQKDDRIGLVTTGAFVGWYSNACEAMNTAEAQVLRLTEENEALRKERTSLIETKREQIEQLTAERDAMARHSLRAGNDAARMAIEKKALADLVKEHGSAKLIRLARTTLQKEQADG